jgi:formate-dependent nitrite reductase cytochrome c552 subunit
MYKMIKYLALFTTLLFTTVMFGCSGDDGTNGTSFGTVSGTVTDTGGNKLAGITVTPSPAVTGITNVATDANGVYSLTIPNGNFTLTFAKAGYATKTQAVTVVATQTTTVNVTLTQTAAAVVNVANAKFVNGSATLSATALVNDPALQGQAATFEWKDAAGNVVGTDASISVLQPTTAAFKAVVAEEVKALASIDPADVFIDEDGEENAHKDIRVFETLDRLMVVGIAQEAFESAAVTPYTVTATIAGQSFTSKPTVSVPTNTLPFVPNPGLRNVPIGQPVMLQGKNNTATGTWNWTITAPAGSTITALVDPATRFPHFIPDAVGTYTVTETVSGFSLTIYAGKYIGILVPATDNNPLGALDTPCSQAACHPASLAFNSPINAKFDEWKQSGHSGIMVQGMSDPAGHYSLVTCAKCHSVGFAQYSSAIKAGGFDETYRAEGFSFKQGAPTFVGFPNTLRLSEVQCENCHGPNDSGAHNVGAPANAIAAKNDAVTARISYSSDVCGTCHGEPLRHGRFQEWRESGHGDFETAIGEGFSGGSIRTSCAGCHTGQGFIQFVKQLQAGDPRRDLNATSLANLAGMTPDNVQPQTCVTCHIPHNAGTQSGLVGAIVILRGDYQTGGAFDGITPLLPAGFQANGVGRGALCITCHNSRNGNFTATSATATLHEDGDVNWGLRTAVTSGNNSYSAPHEACQGDVLMGRNAYFFGTGQIGERSRHSILADACVTCHLQKTPADPNFGLTVGASGAGTNHSFGIITDATKTVNEQINALCSQCHGNFDGTGVQKSFTTSNNALVTELGIRAYLIKTGRTPAQDSATVEFIPGRTAQIRVNGTLFNLGRPSVNSANTAVTTPGWLATLVSFGATSSANVYAGITAAAAAPNTNGAGTSDAVAVGTVLNSQGYVGALAKANWNAVLVETDASKGVHNPSFTFNVIGTTIAVLGNIR